MNGTQSELYAAGLTAFAQERLLSPRIAIFAQFELGDVVAARLIRPVRDAQAVDRRIIAGQAEIERAITKGVDLHAELRQIRIGKAASL